MYRASNDGKPQMDGLVIIPTYKEAANLGPLVRQILARGLFDVLVVDDHSPDGTGDVADELVHSFPGRVMVMHRQGKQGLGTAYIKGFVYALRATCCVPAISMSSRWMPTSPTIQVGSRPCERPSIRLTSSSAHAMWRVEACATGRCGADCLAGPAPAMPHWCSACPPMI